MVLGHDGIDDWLPFQSRRKPRPASVLDEGKFFWPTGRWSAATSADRFRRRDVLGVDCRVDDGLDRLLRGGVLPGRSGLRCSIGPGPRRRLVVDSEDSHIGLSDETFAHVRSVGLRRARSSVGVGTTDSLSPCAAPVDPAYSDISPVFEEPTG
jgi:hypothetical protein